MIGPSPHLVSSLCNGVSSRKGMARVMVVMPRVKVALLRSAEAKVLSSCVPSSAFKRAVLAARSCTATPDEEL